MIAPYDVFCLFDSMHKHSNNNNQTNLCHPKDENEVQNIFNLMYFSKFLIKWTIRFEISENNEDASYHNIVQNLMTYHSYRIKNNKSIFNR